MPADTKTPSKPDICEKFSLDPDNMPQHVAIIMDGNGRWAKKRHLPRSIGHRNGVEALRKTIKLSVSLCIRYLSVYVFSTENWRRPEKEVSFLMGFVRDRLMKEAEELNRNGVRVRFVGTPEHVNEDVLGQLYAAEEKTKANTKMDLNLLFNYGGRMDILQAAQKWAKDPNKPPLTEDSFAPYLLTTGIPDPDILIRTGGDTRISNFLLWQTAYSEFFFLDDLWPDFNETRYCDVIRDFQNRQRRFGGV